MDRVLLFSDSAYFAHFPSIDLKLLKQELLDYIEKNDKDGRNLSNIGGYQSNDLNIDLVLKYIEIPKVLDLLFQECSNIIKKNIVISNIWININKFGDYNNKHSHPGSVLSGAFYVDIPDLENDGGEFLFHRNRSHIDYSLHSLLENVENPEDFYAEYTYKPIPGQAVIFPSSLEHSVRSNSSNKDRISLSFNTTLER